MGAKGFAGVQLPRFCARLTVLMSLITLSGSVAANVDMAPPPPPGPYMGADSVPVLNEPPVSPVADPSVSVQMHQPPAEVVEQSAVAVIESADADADADADASASAATPLTPDAATATAANRIPAQDNPYLNYGVVAPQPHWGGPMGMPPAARYAPRYPPPILATSGALWVYACLGSSAE
ncbi:MAG TPA: hypothetical protein EYN01_05410 [Chromatiales bacterium]|nr:hypothetical protein [Chromatiales bacterium]